MENKKVYKIVWGGFLLFLLIVASLFIKGIIDRRTGPISTFDWNASVKEKFKDKYKEEYIDPNTGQTVEADNHEAKTAYEKLQAQKKKISDKKVKKALELIDGLYIDQKHLNKLIEATGNEDAHSMYRQTWKFVVKNDENKQLKENYSFTYQKTSYKLSDYVPMLFKLNTNSLGRSRAYELKDYKVDGDKVTLKLGVRTVDPSQYLIAASVHEDYSSFFKPLGEISEEAVSKKDASLAYASRTVYFLAAKDFDASSYVNLYGTMYEAKNLKDIYVQIKVDKKGNLKVDEKNLVTLLQVSYAETEKAYASMFAKETTKDSSKTDSSTAQSTDSSKTSSQSQSK